MSHTVRTEAGVIIRGLVTASTAALRGAKTAGLARWRCRRAHLPAVLLDIDSIGVPLVDLPAALAAIDRHVGPTCARLAAGHPTTARAQGMCRTAGYEVLPVRNGGRNAADNALIQRASLLHQHAGVSTFYIVTRDSRFATAPGHIRVIVFGSAEPPRRLRKAAQSTENISLASRSATSAAATALHA